LLRDARVGVQRGHCLVDGSVASGELNVGARLTSGRKRLAAMNAATSSRGTAP